MPPNSNSAAVKIHAARRGSNHDDF
jgi:hypothetical protein